MIEARTDYNNLINIFCMKYPDYVMNIMASWMTLDKLEGASTRRYFIYNSGMKDIKHFTYRHPFGIHFRYIQQVENHNNQRHVPISLDMTRGTKFWPDRKFALDIAVSEVNTAHESGRFQNDGVLQPGLDFRRALENRVP